MDLNRRWSKREAVTPSDSVDNLLVNDHPVTYIQNIGTSGVVSIIDLAGVTANMYFTQGVMYEFGGWKRARATGLGAGVSLIAYY